MENYKPPAAPRNVCMALALIACLFCVSWSISEAIFKNWPEAWYLLAFAVIAGKLAVLLGSDD